MPTVPNNYAGWTVSSAQTNVEAAGLVLGVVPSASSTDPTRPSSNQESDTINTNANDSRKGAEKADGGWVSVVLNAAR